MTEYIINKTIEMKEICVQKEIFTHIDNNKSFYFLAGAGSGKTYALIESLKYYLNNHQLKLNKTGKKLACITYTNAAKKEIIDRLYENENVSVSTIHTFLWSIIESHQPELIATHIEYLKEVILNIKFSLNEDDKNNNKNAYKKFRSLDKNDKNQLLDVISLKGDSFYSTFRITVINDFWHELNNILGDSLYFKLKAGRVDVEKIIKDLIKVNKLKECISRIESGDEYYQKVNYNEVGGKEVLHRNKIGHDTLITYFERMAMKYYLLKKIIIDSYPVVFIDEYQDTHSQVIKLFDSLISYSKEYNLDFTVGLFGDPVQAIYSNNQDNKEIVNNLESVEKNINRRSHRQIIECINKIRGTHQEIEQVSIYKNKDIGDVSFYISKITDVDHNIVISKSIEEHKHKWNIDSKNKLNCMVLKNKNLSELCEFEGFYKVIDDIYKDKSTLLRFDSLNDELLSKDLSKLGALPLAIYKIIKPIFFLKYDEQRPLTDIFSSESLRNHNLENIINCLDELRNNKYTSIKSYMQDVIKKSIVESNISNLYKELNIYSVNSLEEFNKCLCSEVSDSPSEKLENNIEMLTELDIGLILNWMKFILKTNKDNDINYLTCHSSKGLEFDNVLVILDDRFGKKSTGGNETQKFSSLLKSKINETLDIDLENTRNLLYVVCSRSIVNLSVILFTDNPPSIPSVERIFNKVSNIQ